MKNTNLLGVIALLCLSFSSYGQDFMMQGWYWDYPKPANPNGNPITESTFAKTLNTQISDLSSAGFTYVWLPPLSRSSFGHNSNGYDPMDLFDLGGYGLGATGFGFEQDITNLISTFNANNIKAVADVVYNHRDGGLPEANPAVEGWIEGLDYNKVNSGDNAFPSDRFRCILPIGGTTGNGAGDYYIKVRSRSYHPNYFNKPYKIYSETNLVGWQNASDNTESEPNGGGGCGEGNNTIYLGVNTLAWTDSGGCYSDEFKLSLDASDFDSNGDTLYIYLTNVNGDYSDHDIIDIYAPNGNIESQLVYQTYTDHTQHASGRGGMNYLDFKPNGNPTQLNGDWDWLWFFYDYDQGQQSTVDTLTEWTKWLWNDVGIRGFRMDAVKHFPESFVGELMNDLNSSSINPSMVVGEFYDSNASLLKNWVDDVRSHMNAGADNAIDIRIFDFALRQSIKDACDAFGYDTRNVFNSGLVDDQAASGYNVVTFVNNHDFRDAGQSVQNDPMLAYAYILTNNQLGVPCVYYPDYFGVARPNAPTVDLHIEIDQLMNIHQNHIVNSSTVHYLNRFNTPYYSYYNSNNARENTSLIYQLTDNPNGQDVVVAINFAGEELDVYHEIDMANVNAGTPTFTLMNGTDEGEFETITSNNELHIVVPARSYLVYLEDNVSRAPLPVELINFDGTLLDEKVSLEWNVGVEVEVQDYEVQRSFDSKDFISLTSIDAKGDDSNYDFMDERLEGVQGKVYYRLKINDLDGSVQYSDQIQFNLGSDLNDLSVYPTVASEQIRLKSASKAFVTVEILDANGVVVFSTDNVRLSDDIDLDTSEFKPGVYQLRVKSGQDDIVVRSFVKH